MALNLAKAVIGFLKERFEEKFTARQIAEWVFATYPDECQAKKQSSQRLETDTELLQQVVRAISKLSAIQKVYISRLRAHCCRLFPEIRAQPSRNQNFFAAQMLVF